MRVATWNLWWKFGPWEERQDPIGAELQAVDADICCLQEVWSDEDGDQAEMLAERMGRHVARSEGDGGRPQRFGNAVLSRWPVLDHHTVVLPGNDGGPSHRSALFCRIDVPGLAYPIWVVSTHLEWRYTGSRLRQQQLETLVAEASRLRRLAADTIVVIGGDFNAVPESDELRRLTGLAEPYGDGLHEPVVFTDTWAAVGDGPGHTWSRDNHHSANAQWPRRRVDGVFVSWPRPKPTGNPLSAHLFGIDAYGGVVPSDHYGVVVELDRRTPEDLDAIR